MEVIAEIRRRHLVSGESISSIARDLKLSRPTVRKHLRTERETVYLRQHQPLPIKWLLVDESQDMDEVQMEWILLHGRAGAEITLVGDDDQSLYAFRHAMGYAGLQEITFALASMEVTLPVNYRCAQNILEHAARLIAHNKNRAEKKIVAHRTDQGKISILRLVDRDGEADTLTRTILEDAKDAQWAVRNRPATTVFSPKFQ